MQQGQVRAFGVGGEGHHHKETLGYLSSTVRCLICRGLESPTYLRAMYNERILVSNRLHTF